MKSMYLCADDISALLSRPQSAEHIKLLRRFVSGNIIENEAKSEPQMLKDALIESYFEILPVSYHYKLKAVCKDFDVFRTTVDCAKIERERITDFDEIVAVNYHELDELRSKTAEDIKHYNKDAYNRAQLTMLCTDLRAGGIVFIGVESYSANDNRLREITAVDCVKFRIKRDTEAIEKIKSRGAIFGKIRSTYVQQSYLPESAYVDFE